MPITRVKEAPQVQDPGTLAKSIDYLLGGLTVPSNIYKNVLGYLGEPSNLGPGFQELYRQKSGYTPQQLQPSAFGENVLQRFLEYAPITAATGGGIPGLASTGIGAGLATGGKELGLPEWAQTLLHLGGELASGRAISAIPTTGKQAARSFGGLPELYNTERLAAEAAAGVKPTGPISDFLAKPFAKAEKLYDTLPKESQGILKEVQRIMRNLKGHKGTGNFLEALNARRSLDEISKNAPKQLYDVLGDFRKELNNFLKYNNPVNPEFAANLTRADKIKQLEELIKPMNKMVQDWEKGFFLGKIGGPLRKILAKGTESLSRAAILIKNDPELALKYFNKLGNAVIKDNAPAGANVLSQINKAVTKENNKPKITSVKRGKIYRLQT
jgi:hypothetical protein